MRRFVLLVVVVLAAGVSGCGDGDLDEPSGAEVSRFCDAVEGFETLEEPDAAPADGGEVDIQARLQSYFSSPEMSAALDELSAAALPEVADDVEVLVGAIRAAGETGDLAGFQSADVQAAGERVGEVGDERCTPAAADGD